MRIQYNSPVVLTFALICAGLMGLTELVGHHFMVQWFAVPGKQAFNATNPLHWFRIFSHVFGHGSWNHLLGNMTFILLLGPMLEEKFKGANLIIMIAITAGLTGILNVLFFNSALMGASGVVFMMILLGSFSNQKSNSIPLTFVLVSILFLTREFANVFAKNNISEFAHIFGGIMGSLFGFLKKR